MKKILFALLGMITICLHGCSDEAVEGINSIPPDTRAARAATVVWQAQPGGIDIPLGQAVTVNLDGSVIK